MCTEIFMFQGSRGLIDILAKLDHEYESDIEIETENGFLNVVIYL